MVNINELVAQAQAMQQKVKLAQQALAEQEVVGVSKDGKVKITMACNKEVSDCEIDGMKRLDVVEAFREAKAQADEISTATMEEATSGLEMPAGIDLPV